MKNKRGFTLIELLAVMVILAILAVITTPLVLGYIEDTKKETAIVSAKEYLKSIEQNNMTAKIDENYSIIESGNVEDINEKIKIKGDIPTDGKIIIADNNTVDKAILCISGYRVDYIDGKAKVGNKCSDNGDLILFNGTYLKASDDKTYKAIIYLDPDNLTNKCDESIYNNNFDNYNMNKKFGEYITIYKKSPTGLSNGCMKWYVYKIDEEKYYLLLDHNTSAGVAWNKEGVAGGMKEVAQKLKEDTEMWSSDLTLNVTYDNFNYKGYKARLITADEVAEITGADRAINWSSDRLFVSGGDINTEDFTYGHFEQSEILNKYISTYFFSEVKSPSLIWQDYSIIKDAETNAYSWLYNYLSQSGNGIEFYDNNKYSFDEWLDLGEWPQLRGYWTSTPMHPEPTQTIANAFENMAWNVGRASIEISDVDVYRSTSGYKDIGIRPVIEVPKYFFE